MQGGDPPPAADPTQPDIDRRASGSQHPSLGAPLPEGYEHTRRIREDAAILRVDDLNDRTVRRAEQGGRLARQYGCLAECCNPRLGSAHARASGGPRADRLNDSNSMQLRLRFDVAAIGPPCFDMRERSASRGPRDRWG